MAKGGGFVHLPQQGDPWDQEDLTAISAIPNLMQFRRSSAVAPTVELTTFPAVRLQSKLMVALFVIIWAAMWFVM